MHVSLYTCTFVFASLLNLPPFKLIAFSFESAVFESQIKPQGPEEMCLSLETNMVYFDRVTVSLHI